MLGGAESSLRDHLAHAESCNYALAWPGSRAEVPFHAAARQFVVRLPDSYRGAASVLAPVRLLWSVARLLRAARACRPDLVVAYSSLSMPAASVVARLLGIPCLWHVREVHSTRFPTRAMARASSRIVVPSGRLAGFLSRRMDRQDVRKIRVLPSPIEPARFERSSSTPAPATLRETAGLPADGKLILMIAQHVPWKGHLDLIDAFPRIRESVGDARLLLVGAPWVHWDRVCSRRIRERMQDLMVRGQGFIHPPTEHVKRYYWMADLLVLPSRSEPFGRVVFESIAAGLPPIACEDSGVAELLKETVPELFFPPGAPEALAETAIRALRADRATQEGWLRRGRAVLDEHCAADVIVPQLESIYVEAAARR